MFSGVGGFRLGLERSGWKCVWANDFDKYANIIYKKKFGSNELVEGDIREIQAETVPDHTLLTAGFPCQAFSVAGKRKGINEARGTLFYHIARIAAVKRPQFLLLENVKGLLSSESGRTFAVILRTLAELGYILEWQVLNSKHFGVPQNRERVFVVGHLGGKGFRQIFPIAKSSEEYSEVEQAREISATIDRSYYKGYDHKRQLIISKVGYGQKYSVHEACSTLRGMARHNNVPMVAQLVGDRDNPSISVKNEAFCLPSNPMSDRQQMVVANAVDRDGYLRFGERPRDENGKPQLLPIGYRRIRRLTPTECERLQGFPDNYTEGVSDTQRYKLLGNAITTNVAEFLGKELSKFLEKRNV